MNEGKGNNLNLGETFGDAQIVENARIMPPMGVYIVKKIEDNEAQGDFSPEEDGDGNFK